MNAVTAAEKQAVANIGKAYCSQCGKCLALGAEPASDCREHGVGVYEFASSWASQPVQISYSNDECDGIQIWRMKHGGLWVSVTPDNFLDSQIDVWVAEAQVHFDGMTRRINTDFDIDAYHAAREAA